MAAAVATVASTPASRRLPAHPLSASTAAPSLVRLPGSSRRLRRALRVSAAAEDPDVLPGPGAGDLEMLPAGLLEDLPLPEGALGGSQLDIGGLAFQGDMGGGFAPGGSTGGGDGGGNKMLDRGINTAIVLGASTYALTKLLTVDQDYWHVRTFFFFFFILTIPCSNC
jgi:protein Mpv17